MAEHSLNSVLALSREVETLIYQNQGCFRSTHRLFKIKGARKNV